MARVTSDEVKVLIDTSRTITTMIDAASLVVSESLVGKGLSDDRLKLIELYLAAHFVAITEEKGGLTGQKQGDAEDTFQLPVGMGYKLTRFGQQALQLDTTGTLLSQSQTGASAQFRVI